MLHSKEKFDADQPAGFDGLFHWEYINMAFQDATGRPIQCMDIDAHVEIGGHHLFFETKREGVEVPWGQKKALRELWAKGYAMVIILWGKEDPIACEIWWPAGGEKEILKGRLTKERLFEICKRWAVWADKPENRCPFQYMDPAA